MTDEIDASTEHHPTAFITTCHHQRQGPNYTFSCSAAVVLAQDTWFVHRSDSPVLTFWKLEFSPNERGVAPTSLRQPNVGLFPIRAADHPDCCGCFRFNCHMAHKQKSFRIDCSPIPSVAALTTAGNSNSPLLRARTPIVSDHAFTNWPLHIATPPTVDFLVEWHPAKFASPNTSMLLSNWVHGYLQVIRDYLIGYHATLLRAVRSCVRGEAIFRINSFTEYKRSGLSMSRKLHLAATLWKSFSSTPVRRSSSSSISSGRSAILPFYAAH